MAFDSSPQRLEAVFIQRNSGNTFYEEINISGSDLIVYLDKSTGSINADKVTTWAGKYGISVGSSGSVASASWASQSLSSSYALTASEAIHSISASYFSGSKITASSILVELILPLGSSIGNPTMSFSTVYANKLFGTASWATQSFSASVSQTSSIANSASYSITSSFINSNTNAFIQGGNSFGQSGSLGTNDLFNLVIRANGQEALYISASLSASVKTVGVGINADPGAFPLIIGGTGQVSLSGSSNRLVTTSNSSSIKISGGGGITNGAKLELYGEGSPSLIVAGNELMGGALLSTKLNSSFILQNFPNIGVLTSGTTLMVVTSTGKVAIGMNNPTASLDVNGDIRTSTNVTASNLWISHLVGSGSSPSIITGSGAGLGATGSVIGTSTAGQITITAGTTPAINAIIATLRYTGSFNTSPYIIISPASPAAASINFTPYILTSPLSFSINTGDFGLTASNAYVWNYMACA